MKKANANELTINRTMTVPAKGKHCNGNSKAILLVEDGEIYFSMTDVAECLDVTVGAVSFAVRNESKVKGKTPILVANLPYKANLLCNVIKSLNQRTRALEADAKGMEAEITRLRAELAKARVLNAKYEAREAKRQEAAELRKKLAMLEKELEVNIA